MSLTITIVINREKKNAIIEVIVHVIYTNLKHVHNIYLSDFLHFKNQRNYPIDLAENVMMSAQCQQNAIQFNLFHIPSDFLQKTCVSVLNSLLMDYNLSLIKIHQHK